MNLETLLSIKKMAHQDGIATPVSPAKAHEHPRKDAFETFFNKAVEQETAAKASSSSSTSSHR